MASPQSEVSALLDDRSEAMRTKDIDRLMPCYSSGVVYFDLVPPLQYAGTDALRDRFLDWFERWEGPIGLEVHDMNIFASGDGAGAFMLLRASGRMKNGPQVGYWVRVTNCCQRFNGKWAITHEHVSLPVDIARRSAVMDLVP